MSDQSFHSFGGGRGKSHGRGRGGQRGGFNRGGRGGFHNNHQSKYYPEVDYSPEAIEARFSAYYSPSVTKDPWSHLTQERTDYQ